MISIVLRRECKVDRLGPCFFGLWDVASGAVLNALGEPRDTDDDEPFAAFLTSERAIKFADAHGWEVVT
jgi:hypothetical protein